MKNDFKELIDFVLCKYDIEHTEADIEGLMFSYGLKHNGKFKEVWKAL